MIVTAATRKMMTIILILSILIVNNCLQIKTRISTGEINVNNYLQVNSGRWVKRAFHLITMKKGPRYFKQQPKNCEKGSEVFENKIGSSNIVLYLYV